MKESLKIKLSNYIRGYQGEQVPHWQVMNFATQNGFRQSNCERRLREMAEVGKVYEHNTIKYYYWRSDSPHTSQNAPKREITDFVGEVKTEAARAFLERFKPKEQIKENTLF